MRYFELTAICEATPHFGLMREEVFCVFTYPVLLYQNHLTLPL